MTLPSKKQVAKDIRYLIAGSVNLPADRLEDDWVLTQRPISFDQNGLVFFAMTLRGYVKQHDPDKTILVRELRKPKLTVAGVVDLTHRRIRE